MEYSQNLRDQVIARLITRHGFDHENAAAVWEEYLLYLFAKSVCGTPAGLHIEDN